MTFAWPFAWLFAVPLAVAAWRVLRRGRRAGVRFSAVARLPAKTAGWRARLANVAPWLFLAGAASLVIAAARPRVPLARERRSVEAIAVVMTVDVSGSMNIIDVSPAEAEKIRTAEDAGKLPTRLDSVKKTFAQFVEARPDDLIGLVTFGGFASSRAPLTADHAALLATLRGVEVPSVGVNQKTGETVDPEETMTAVGDGLAMAIWRIKTAQVKSKVVILLSDGLSNTGAVEPQAAADAAAHLGIRVYTIGVGGSGDGQAFVRARDLFGRERIQSVRAEGFDENQLRSIAKRTGGLYFGVRDESGLADALAEIDKLEKTEIDRTLYDRWNEFFPPFLVVGVLLVFASVTLQMGAARRLV